MPEVWTAGERRDFAGPALIDTHIWIWYLDGADFLPDETVRMLRRCVRGDGLLVSDISIWEIGTKVAKGKLSLSPTLTAWLDRAGRRPGFSFLPLDREILLAFPARIPAWRFSVVHPLRPAAPEDRLMSSSGTFCSRTTRSSFPGRPALQVLGWPTPASPDGPHAHAS